MKIAPVNNRLRWIVVSVRPDTRSQSREIALKVRRVSRPNDLETISIYMPHHSLHKQVIELPSDVTELMWDTTQPYAPDVRVIGRIKRLFYMSARVAKALFVTPRKLRAITGLTLFGAIRDLNDAYRAAIDITNRMQYRQWVEKFDRFSDRDILAMRGHIARLSERPHFHLLISGENDRNPIEATLVSLRGQIYQNFDCVVLGAETGFESPFPHPSNVGQGVQVITELAAVDRWLAEFNASLAGERRAHWIMLLRAGDVLPAHSLYRFAVEIQDERDKDVFYSDDDIIDAAGNRTDPRFKPEWSKTHFYSIHYIGSSAALKAASVAAAGGVNFDDLRHGNYDLLLRVAAEAGGKVAHVPGILLHRGSGIGAESAWENPQWCADMLQAHLARRKVAAEIVQTLPACRRVRYGLPEPAPLVSILLATKDAAELLRNCIESLREKTLYPRFEILVVDNQTRQPDALAYLDEIARYPNVRILRYDHPFNYSVINNFAAREARGDVLCLLNNDTSVISPDWLDELVGHLLQDGVGIVGAKLFYPDSRVQHAGVAVGPGGCADHVHLGFGHNEPGYCHRAVVAQEMSAVTGACFVTWKHLYERLGGLNEELVVAFNDVDYCLRVQEAGYRVIFTPHAELFHHESATRGRDDHLRNWRRARREVGYIRSRWAQRVKHDPYYNPNLSYRRPDFSLSESPRVRKPWL